MPGRNGTGPFGEGPATGRGMGPCSDQSTQRPFGFGSRTRRGGAGHQGQGFRQMNRQNQFDRNQSSNDVSQLKQRITDLEAQIQELKKQQLKLL